MPSGRVGASPASPTQDCVDEKNKARAGAQTRACALRRLSAVDDGVSVLGAREEEQEELQREPVSHSVWNLDKIVEKSVSSGASV